MSIADLTYVKTHLGISTDTEDDRLEQWILAVDQIIENDLAYAVMEATKTEYLTGTGGPLLFLRHRHVTSITNIWQDSQGWFDQASGFDSSTLLVAGTDYALVTDDEDDVDVSWSAVVRRIGGVWPMEFGKGPGDLVLQPVNGRGNIKVVYVCGYATADMPEDLKLAAAIMVSMVRRVGKAGGPISGFSFEGFSQQFGAAAPDDLTSVANILASNRKWIWNQ